jgi:hypothetical protein
MFWRVVVVQELDKDIARGEASGVSFGVICMRNNKKMSNNHGTFACECDCCTVLLNATRIENYIKECLGGKRMRGLGQMAQQVRGLDLELKVAIQVIATVRNRFCHSTPWFLDEWEKSHFKQQVRFCTEKFSLDQWRLDPFRAKPSLFRQAYEANVTPNQGKPQILAKSPTFTTESGIYEVPIDAPESVRQKVKEAEEFAASQREAISASQQMGEEEANEEGQIWKCLACGADNDVDFLLCAICSEGVAPNRWKCKICTNINFCQDSHCTVCDTVFSITDKLPLPHDAIVLDGEADENNNVSTKAQVEESQIEEIQSNKRTRLYKDLETINNKQEDLNASNTYNNSTTLCSTEGSHDHELVGWVLDEGLSTERNRVYRNVHSNKLFKVEWPLPTGWRLVASSSQPLDRLCFACKQRKQAIYPPKDVPEGWVLVRDDPTRRAYEKIGSGDLLFEEPIIFETPWPLPEGWVLALSKSRPNQLSYLKLSDGTKLLTFPK